MVVLEILCRDSAASYCPSIFLTACRVIGTVNSFKNDVLQN